jgi:hypothetical protein
MQRQFRAFRRAGLSELKEGFHGNATAGAKRFHSKDRTTEDCFRKLGARSAGTKIWFIPRLLSAASLITVKQRRSCQTCGPAL